MIDSLIELLFIPLFFGFLSEIASTEIVVLDEEEEEVDVEEEEEEVEGE